MIKQYERKFYEATFANTQILKAIQLTNRIVSKRIASKIYTSYLPEEFITPEGKFAGLFCLLSGFRKIRYNWKLGKNSEIVSIDFWIRKRKGIVKPDYSIDVQGISAPKLVDIIAKILLGDIEPEFQVITESIKHKEDFAPKTKGQKSSAITKALKQWAIDKDVDNDKLETTRISYLYKDWLYWYNEMASEDIEMMSEMTFRNYIIDFLKAQGLKNIYIRNIKVRQGSKEKIINTDNSSEVAYTDIQHLKMNVSDLRDFIGNSLRAVTRGYQNSLIVAGKAGVGKTTITKQVLNDEGMEVYHVPQIRNISVLYNLFLHNNDPKKVILFDDTTDLFSKKFSGYLSAALDDKPDRIINFPSEVGKDLADFAKYGPDLHFRGKIVILTNVPKEKIPGYLKSRAITIEVNASNEEMADDIRRNLMGVLPEVDMKEKIEVLDFIEKLGKNISSIDYRQYKLCVIFKLSQSPDWKKQVLALLK
jgi:hypothetical protein